MESMTSTAVLGFARIARRSRLGVRRWQRTLLVAALSAATFAAAPRDARAQADSISGVRLGLLYEQGFQPALAVKAFTGRFGGGGVAPRAEGIMARDLRYSDRFEMMDSIPAALGGVGVDYSLWDQLGAVWLLTGQVEGAGNGFLLLVELHDVVYGEVKERGRFRIPDPDSPEFRMAVHSVSDEVVRWATGQPGMAASRIAFSMAVSEGVQELYIVDADGENMRRMTNYGSLTMSPAWSPDGSRIAFSSFKSGDPRIHEVEIATGHERVIDVNRSGQPFTPTYHPNGREITFSVADGARSGLFSFDASQNCCLSQLTGGRWNDLSPTYSPAGDWLAFNSNRLGTAVPQVYVMPARGGEPELMSPFVYGQGGYFTSPDWAPEGDRVAFHGRYQRGRYQILIAEVSDRGRRVLQLTYEGNNEDPSWAPDARHLVFVGERSWGFGLFVVDTVTGRLRPIVAGIQPRVPDWSPTVGSPAVADGGPRR